MAPTTFHIIRCITQAAMYSLPEGPSELQGWWAVVVVVVSLPTTSESCTDCTVLHPANHLLLLLTSSVLVVAVLHAAQGSVLKQMQADTTFEVLSCLHAVMLSGPGLQM